MFIATTMARTTAETRASASRSVATRLPNQKARAQSQTQLRPQRRNDRDAPVPIKKGIEENSVEDDSLPLPQPQPLPAAAAPSIEDMVTQLALLTQLNLTQSKNGYKSISFSIILINGIAEVVAPLFHLIIISLCHGVLLQLVLELPSHLTNILQMLEIDFSISLFLSSIIACRSQCSGDDIPNLSSVQAVLVAVVVDEVVNLLTVINQGWL